MSQGTVKMQMCDASGTMFPAGEKMFMVAVPGSDDLLMVANTTIAHVLKEKRRSSKTGAHESRRVDLYEVVSGARPRKGDFCFSIAIDDCRILEEVYEKLSVHVS